MEPGFTGGNTGIKKMENDLLIKRSAEFSPCRTWRYTLVREWDSSKPRLLMILLNPSTADASKDDPTNRRGIQYAIDWGFGSLCFCNLFAFRTPRPKEMKAAFDPVGPENNNWIHAEADKAAIVLVGWGNDGVFKDRASSVLIGLALDGKKIYCLEVNKNGQPKHPLYCRADLKPKLYRG